MCLHVKTNHTNPPAIGYSIEHEIPVSLKNNLADILNNVLVAKKADVKKLKLNDSINFDISFNESGVVAFNVNIQLLMKSARVRGDSAFKYWKFCIHKKTD